jgi:bacteriocin biosynthesis cyclodehydratase domain-containing protein
MNHPRIKRHYSIVAHSADTVELRYGVWNPVSFTLNDESKKGCLHRLLSGMDGSVALAALAEREKVPRGELEALADHLDQLGVLETGPSNSLDYYLENLVPGGGRVPVGQHRPLPVKLLGDDYLCGCLARMLADDGADLAVDLPAGGDPAVAALIDPDTSWLSDGLRFEERLTAFEGWRDSLIVYVQRVINPIRFRTLNRICLAIGTPWLHAAFDGPFLFVGPTVVPNRTACYRCFETRVAINLRETASYARYKGAIAEGRVQAGCLPVEGVLGSMLCSHAAWEAMSYATTRHSFTTGKVLAIYLPTMEVSFNDVLRVSGCEDCGPVSERDDRELYFDLRSVILEASGRAPGQR